MAIDIIDWSSYGVLGDDKSLRGARESSSYSAPMPQMAERRKVTYLPRQPSISEDSLGLNVRLPVELLVRLLEDK